MAMKMAGNMEDGLNSLNVGNSWEKYYMADKAMVSVLKINIFIDLHMKINPCDIWLNVFPHTSNWILFSQ